MSRRRGTGLRAARSIGVVVLGAVMVGGCAFWPMFRTGPGRSGYNASETTINAANVAGLHPVWTDVTGTSVNSPVVAYGVTFVAAGGTLFAFDAAGKQRCGGAPRQCMPLWTGATGGTFQSYVAVAGDVVFVASTDALVAFDRHGVTGCGGTPKTCAPLWRGPLSCETDATLCQPSAPVVAGGTVYLGVTSYGSAICCRAHVVAFAAAGVSGCSGAPKSCLPLRRYEIDCGVGFLCSPAPPAVAKGILYVGSTLDQQDFGSVGNVFAFSAAGITGCSGSPVTCVPLWTSELTLGVSGTAVSQGVVYVTQASFPGDPDSASPSGSVRAFDAAGVRRCSGVPKICASLWSVSTAPIVAPPAVAHGSVYVSVYPADLHVFNATNGAEQWTGITGFPVPMAPTVAGDVVYVETNGNLYAFDANGSTSCAGIPKTCSSLRTLPGAAATWGNEAAVSNGRIYVAGSDAVQVYALS